MVLHAFVGLKLRRRQHRPEKEPVAMLARNKDRVLALPTQTGFRGEGLLHQWRGIDEDFDLSPRRFRKRARQGFDLLLQHVVVIVALGVN